MLDGETQILIGRESEQQENKRSFTYDKIFSQNSSQDDIYSNVAAPLVMQFFEGFNATILAYGQTFSGKTYTMGSGLTDNKDAAGIIPRVFNDLFSKIEQDPKWKYEIKISFLEVYQEQVRDLLAQEQREITIRESKGSITVSGIQEHTASCLEDVLDFLAQGAAERSTGDTQMHLHSSRSHAIFTIILEQMHASANNNPISIYNSGTAPPIVRRSKLHLVDLAGSERLKRTGAEGVRLKESVKINSGLLALGNVISVLGAEKSSKDVDRGVHVPYRDSKLTRLLQDSLGGNSKTVMIACVSSLDEDLDETLNTLKYAYRAKKIQNKPVLNVMDVRALEMTSMKEKIDLLETQLKGIEGQPILPQSIDFENEDWMQYFMDQLKSRTIRGTNAIRSLEASNDLNRELQTRLEAVTEENEKLKSVDTLPNLKLSADNNQKAQFHELQFQDERKQHNEALQRLSLEMADTEKDLSALLDFSVSVFKSAALDLSDGSEICKLIKTYRPEVHLSMDKKIDAESIGLPLIAQSERKVPNLANKRPTTDANHPRTKRRESKDDEVNTKPLEFELKETRKYVMQLEEELASTKVQLHQNEAMAEENAAQVSRLQRSISTIMVDHGNVSAEDAKGEIVSIKLLANAAVQTLAVPAQNLLETSELDDYPVHVNQSETAGEASAQFSVERLSEELSAAMKAKVDLLRELTKVNKDTEKMRHSNMDHVQKLEREIESLERELSRAQEENAEKELHREKSKDEYERKLKQQETTLTKYKARQRELEKSAKDKSLSDRKLQELHQECDRLQQQIVNQKKRTKDDQEKSTDLEQRRSKEVAALNKQIEDESKKSRHLEAKIEVMRKKLDRKTEDLALLSRKAKDANAAGMPLVMKNSRTNILDEVPQVSALVPDRAPADLPLPVKSSHDPKVHD